MKDLLLIAGVVLDQNLKYDIFTSSFRRLRHQIAPKSVPHVHDYFLINQSNHGFVALSIPLPSFFLDSL